MCPDQIYETRDEQDVAFLRSFSLFSELSGDKIKEILLQLNRKVLSNNHCLYHEGDQPDKIYFLREGEVEVDDRQL